MPAFDANLMFKSSGNLTKGSTNPITTALKIRGTPISGMAVQWVIPSWPGTTAKLLPDVRISADNSTYRTVANYPLGAQCRLKTASGEVLMVPFVAPVDMPYVKVGFTITGGTTASSWGAIKVGLVHLAASDWKRAGIVGASAT